MSAQVRPNPQAGRNKGTIVLGAWEMLAPLILGYASRTDALLNGLLCGAVYILLGIGALRTARDEARHTLNGWVIAVGVWLVLAPFILVYGGATAAVWNDVIVGIIGVVLGWTGLRTARQAREGAHPAA